LNNFGDSKKKLLDRIKSAVFIILLIILSLEIADTLLFRVFFALAIAMSITEIECALRELSPLIKREYEVRATVCLELTLLVCGGFAVSFYAPLEGLGISKAEIYLILGTSCITDAAAYFVGNIFHGKLFATKPFPVISPKKSWEGIVGGVLGGMLTSVIILQIIHSGADFTTGDKFFILFVTPFAIFGDYLASRTKRALRIKDSNTYTLYSPTLVGVLEWPLKSHGGYLDRVDSIVAVAILYVITHLTP